jgi:hypothetical protein
MQPHHQGLIDLDAWPAEPNAPETIDKTTFTQALRRLCRGVGPRKARRYARWVLDAAETFEVDPFTVAAVIYDQTRCKARYRSRYGRGLAALNWHMHRRHATRRGYRYHVWDAETSGWKQRILQTGRHRFQPGYMRSPRGSIYLTAALLRVFREQCPHIDGAFGSVPHRHPVSHLVFGDRVADPAYEDNILRARRRLLELYEGHRPQRCGGHQGLALYSPVDGLPRKVLSGWGAPRFRGGRRKHKGIDFFGPRGAPIFAVAAGEVIFAGASIRRGRRGRSVQMPYRRARRIGRRRLALSGYFVMIRHETGLISAYMHLAAFNVERGERVKGGQLIGLLGDTGLRRSKAHLHFELREPPREHIDPLPLLGDCFFPPTATYVGRWRTEYYRRKAVARAERRKRWLARRAARREARARKRARLRRRKRQPKRHDARRKVRAQREAPATTAPPIEATKAVVTVPSAEHDS